MKSGAAELPRTAYAVHQPNSHGSTHEGTTRSHST